MNKYYSYGQSSTSSSRLSAWLNAREPFKNSGNTFHSVEPIVVKLLKSSFLGNFGSLEADWGRVIQARIELIDYFVYSYRTPIAWHDKECGWVIPNIRYSNTTSRHQSAIRAAVRDYVED